MAKRTKCGGRRAGREADRDGSIAGHGLPVPVRARMAPASWREAPRLPEVQEPELGPAEAVGTQDPDACRLRRYAHMSDKYSRDVTRD